MLDLLYPVSYEQDARLIAFSRILLSRQHVLVLQHSCFDHCITRNKEIKVKQSYLRVIIII
jgi:hypothetical protein